MHMLSFTYNILVTKLQDILVVFEQACIHNSSSIAVKTILCELENLIVQTQPSAGVHAMMDP